MALAMHPCVMTEPLPKQMQRLGPLAQLPGALDHFGIDLPAVLDGLPVTPDDLRPDAFLPLALISRILERAALLTGCGEFGLVLAHQQDQAALGPAGDLMRFCPTLGSALSSFASFQIANSTAAAVFLQKAGSDYAFCYGSYDPEPPSSIVYDVAAAIGCNIIRHLTGGAIRPSEVLLSRPPPARPASYHAHFQCPVRFDQPQCCIFIPAHAMDFPLPSHDARRRESLLLRLDERMTAANLTATARVRHALRPLLTFGDASLPGVAAHLGFHPRALERKLTAEKARFEDLKDSVREAVSRELLSHTQLPSSDIAATVGYATPSAFVRAFRRWTGQSPGAWRREFAATGPQRTTVVKGQTPFG